MGDPRGGDCDGCDCVLRGLFVWRESYQFATRFG